MSKEKQIEEMARSLCLPIMRYTPFVNCERCRSNGVDITRCIFRKHATILTEKGYRKQSEVIDEFSDRLKEAPIKLGLPLLGLSTKEEIEEYFDGIMLQVRDAIDKIAKEMKGDEK